jgi:glycogen synthase kinase 3 beta
MLNEYDMSYLKIKHNPSQNLQSTTTSSKQNIETNYTNLIPIGSGAFGSVYKATCEENGEIVAIKKVYQDSRYINRELSILLELNHINTIKLKNYYYTNKKNSDNEKCLNVVMDYFPENLSHFIRNHSLKSHNPISIIDLKIFSYQMFHALNYLNSIGICHRDIKPQNILINEKKKLIQICDFGSAKKLKKGESNISYICSRYYRAPELIFNAIEYTNSIDIWSVCCVLCEMILGKPFFPGENSIDQLIEIIKILGTPNRNDIKNMNFNYKYYKFPLVKCFPLKFVFKEFLNVLGNDFIDLLQKIFVYDPNKRIKPIQALCHNFFDDLRKEGVVEEQFRDLIFTFSKEEIDNDKDNIIINYLIPEWFQQKI